MSQAFIKGKYEPRYWLERS